MKVLSATTVYFDSLFTIHRILNRLVMKLIILICFHSGVCVIADVLHTSLKAFSLILSLLMLRNAELCSYQLWPVVSRRGKSAKLFHFFGLFRYVIFGKSCVF